MRMHHYIAECTFMAFIMIKHAVMDMFALDEEDEDEFDDAGLYEPCSEIK